MPENAQIGWGSPDPHVSGAAQSCPGLKLHFGLVALGPTLSKMAENVCNRVSPFP